MTTTAIPNTVELVHRLHRVARIVVEFADDPPNDGAAIGLGMWEIITGIDDAEAALRYARRVAAPEWPGRYMTEVGS